MRRILVTGGCGFIGSNFLNRFVPEWRNDRFINLDKLTYAGLRSNTAALESNERYQFVHGDICDSKLVSALMQQVDSVVHFAAETHVDRSIASSDEFVRTNVLGTNVLLSMAKEHGVKKFIHFSTDEVYGSIESGSFHESSPLNPTSPYSAAKAASDLLALAYWKTHGVPVTVLRCSNNFGPRQFPEKVVPLFITNLIEEKKVPLYAAGQNIRDWLYVGDCVEAVGFLLDKGQTGEIYNVGGGHELSNLELTRQILSQFDKTEDWIQYVADRPAHDFRYSIQSSKLNHLGFSVQSKFSDRIKETIDWYRENESWWKPLKKDRFTNK